MEEVVICLFVPEDSQSVSHKLDLEDFQSRAAPVSKDLDDKIYFCKANSKEHPNENLSGVDNLLRWSDSLL